MISTQNKDLLPVLARNQRKVEIVARKAHFVWYQIRKTRVRKSLKSLKSLTRLPYRKVEKSSFVEYLKT